LSDNRADACLLASAVANQPRLGLLVARLGLLTGPRSDRKRAARLLVYWLGSVLFTLFSVLGAYAAIWLPFSPVPITLQLLPVLTAGLVLGPRWGAWSQVQYLLLGLVGWPVFAAAAPGPAAFASPSAGYLLGFVLGAYTTGRAGRWLARWQWFGALASSYLGIIAVYCCGAAWLGIWLAAFAFVPLRAALAEAWLAGVAPFIVVDVAKAVLAASAWRGSCRCWSLLWPSSS